MAKKIEFDRFTTNDIAKAFGVKASIVHGWAKQGCPRIKTGGIWRYNLPEVIAWRIENLGYKTDIDDMNTKDLIIHHLKEVIIDPTAGAAAKVKAAKQLEDLEKESGESEGLAKAIMFLDVMGHEDILEATGEVSVRCPSCKTNIKFTPV